MAHYAKVNKHINQNSDGSAIMVRHGHDIRKRGIEKITQYANGGDALGNAITVNWGRRLDHDIYQDLNGLKFRQIVDYHRWLYLILVFHSQLDAQVMQRAMISYSLKAYATIPYRRNPCRGVSKRLPNPNLEGRGDLIREWRLRRMA